MLLLLMLYAPQLRDLSASEASHRTWANSWPSKAELRAYVRLTTLGFRTRSRPRGAGAATHLGARAFWPRAATKRKHPGSVSRGAARIARIQDRRCYCPP